jgi:hypothetical protein
MDKSCVKKEENTRDIQSVVDNVPFVTFAHWALSVNWLRISTGISVKNDPEVAESIKKMAEDHGLSLAAGVGSVYLTPFGNRVTVVVDDKGLVVDVRDGDARDVEEDDCIPEVD